MDLNFIIKDEEKKAGFTQEAAKLFAKTVLIIDDSKLNQHLLGTLLQAFGYKVFYADDGEQGLAKFEAIRPSITFLDIVMPKKTGLQVLSEIKLRYPKAIVIMVSSFSSKQNIHEAKKCGADWFLKKPFSKDKIQEIVKAIEIK